MNEPPLRDTDDQAPSPSRWGRLGALFLAFALFSTLRMLSGGYG